MNQTNDRMNVLIVDDKPDRLISLEAILDDLKGLNVVRASSGSEALRHLLTQDFAVILLDVNMPGMDGFETAAMIRMRENSRDTPIIFITAFGDEIHVARGYAAGAVDYILTPVVPNVLRTKVGVFVDLHRKNLEVRHQAQVLRERADQLAALASQLIDAEQRERRRVAMMLHDNLQQLLVAAKMQLNAIHTQDRAAIARSVAGVNDLLQQSIEASRSLTLELSPPILYDCGLTAALQWLVRQMQTQYQLTVDFHASPDFDLPSDNLRVFAFHATRELLFNIVKHAGTERGKLMLVRQDAQYVDLVIEDEGAGFDPVNGRPAGSSVESYGLFSIRERIQLFNGRMSVKSAPGAGTRITLTLPAATQRVADGEETTPKASAHASSSKTS